MQESSIHFHVSVYAHVICYVQRLGTASSTDASELNLFYWDYELLIGQKCLTAWCPYFSVFYDSLLLFSESTFYV